MIEQTSFKRLILRVVLRHVSPMVIRQVSVSDQLDLAEFNDIVCAVLGMARRFGLHHPGPWSAVQQLSPEDAMQSLA
jgi:hypothetical protein